MLMVRKIVLSIMAVLAVCFVAFAQNLQVTGTVKDAAGNPVVGAAVFVEGTTVGTTTGVDKMNSMHSDYRKEIAIKKSCPIPILRQPITFKAEYLYNILITCDAQSHAQAE